MSNYDSRPDGGKQGFAEPDKAADVQNGVELIRIFRELDFSQQRQVIAFALRLRQQQDLDVKG